MEWIAPETFITSLPFRIGKRNRSDGNTRKPGPDPRPRGIGIQRFALELDGSAPDREKPGETMIRVLLRQPLGRWAVGRLEYGDLSP